MFSTYVQFYLFHVSLCFRQFSEQTSDFAARWRCPRMARSTSTFSVWEPMSPSSASRGSNSMEPRRCSVRILGMKHQANGWVKFRRAYRPPMSVSIEIVEKLTLGQFRNLSKWSNLWSLFGMCPSEIFWFFFLLLFSWYNVKVNFDNVSKAYWNSFWRFHNYNMDMMPNRCEIRFHTFLPT